MKADDLAEIRIAPAEGTALTLTASTPPAQAPLAQAPNEAANSPTAPAPKPEWKLSEPAGVKADPGVGTFAATLTGTRAQRFEAADFAAAKEALGGKTWKYIVKSKTGAAVTLIVSDSGGEEVWGRVEGSDEVFALAGWTAKGLRKSLEDLRDRDATTLDVEKITRIDAPKAADGDAAPTNTERVVLTSDGDAWR
jgi:hypothetical protein